MTAGPTILCVSADAALVQQVCRHVAGTSAVVRPAATAAQAQELLQSECPALLLVDVSVLRLPHDPLLQVLHTHPWMPVVVLAAHARGILAYGGPPAAAVFGHKPHNLEALWAGLRARCAATPEPVSIRPADG